MRLPLKILLLLLLPIIGQSQTMSHTSLSSFRGYVIYVDFWASWCGHCLDEMNGPEQILQRHYKGKLVKFVFVDMDESKDIPKAMKIIRSRNIKGTQLLWSEELMKDMQINKPPEFLPTYLLFDKNGKLVNKDAYRPSDGGNIFSQIDSLLRL